MNHDGDKTGAGSAAAPTFIPLSCFRYSLISCSLNLASSFTCVHPCNVMTNACKVMLQDSGCRIIRCKATHCLLRHSELHTGCRQRQLDRIQSSRLARQAVSQSVMHALPGSLSAGPGQHDIFARNAKLVKCKPLHVVAGKATAITVQCSRYLDVEVLPERGVADGGVIHNAQPVSFAALTSPNLAGPCLCPPTNDFTRIRGGGKVGGCWGVGGGRVMHNQSNEPGGWGGRTRGEARPC